MQEEPEEYVPIEEPEKEEVAPILGVSNVVLRLLSDNNLDLDGKR